MCNRLSRTTRRLAIVVLLSIGTIHAEPPAPAAAPADQAAGPLRLRSIIERLHAPALSPGRDGVDSSDAQLQAMSARIEVLRHALVELDGLLTESQSPADRDAALRLRLDCRFELATLEGEPLSELEAELDRLPTAQCGPALAEAVDYWRLRVDLARPAGVDERSAPAKRIRGIEQFLRAHPGSPRRIGLLHELLQTAMAARDFAAVDRWIQRLERDGASDANSVALLGRFRLRRLIGARFDPLLQRVDGMPIEWTSYHGRPVLVVFFGSWDIASCRLLEELASPPSGLNPHGAALVLVSLDESRAAAQKAVESAGVTGALCCDERGRSGLIARRFGLRSLPVVLMLDREGRLRRIIDDVGPALRESLLTGWREMATPVE